MKEHNRKACKYQSYVKFPPQGNLLSVIGTLSEGWKLKEISDFSQFTSLTQIRFQVVKL